MNCVLFLICVYLVWIECSTSTVGLDKSILRNVNKPYNDVSGGYYFEYFTDDRQKRKEEGNFVRTADDQLILRVTGYYQYADTDDKIRRVKYESDENGYRQTVEIVKPIKHGISPNALKSLIG